MEEKIVLNQLFTAIYSGTFTPEVFFICTGVSLALGALIALTTGFRSKQSKSFLLALFLIPAIVQTVIMLVNGSVGTGVAVMGAFSLVRFRSVAGTAKEIVSIFLAMATGLATAMGYVGLAAIFVALICLVMFIVSFVHFKEKDDLVRDLRITVPEDLNYAHEFDDVFAAYTHNAKLLTVKTSNMGSLYKLIYRVELTSEDNVQKFIDELRCRNGNLEIAVMMPQLESNRL